MKLPFLICCIGISKAEFFCFDLLHHFLSHYIGLGIPASHFLLTLHSQSPDDNLAEVNQLLAKFNIEARSSFFCEYDCFKFYEQNFSLMRGLNADDWVIVLDLDEFAVFPSDLPSFIEQMERNGYNVAMGKLIDRIAPHGVLRPIVSGVPIWDQFPIKFPVTRKIARAYDGKTVVFKNFLGTNVGHHAITNIEAGRVYPRIVPVHHFKWDSTLPQKLAKRKLQFQRDPVKYSWHHQITRCIDSIKDGKLSVRPGPS